MNRTCSDCGRGELDGYGWRWSEGRLVHDNADSDCVEEHGILEGMVFCAAANHVVWADQAVLAQMRWAGIRGEDAQAWWIELGTVRLEPRTSGWEPFVARLDADENPLAAFYSLPEGTREVIKEATAEGPILVCRACARQWGEGVVLRPFKKRSGPREAKESATATVRAPAPSEDRHARLKALLDGKRTAREVAAELGVAERTVKRDLEEIGAVGVRDGKYVRWSLP